MLDQIWGISLSKKRRSSSRRPKPISKTLQNVGLAVLAIVVIIVGFIAFKPEPVTTAAPTSPSAAPKPSASQVAQDMIVLKKPKSGDLNILYVGDSLAGSLHASRVEAGFRPLMTRAMDKKASIDERHGHKSGGTATEVAKLVEIGKDNDLAVIELGTNDVGKTSLEDFRKSYSKLISDIKKDSPKVQFLCAGTWQAPDAGSKYDRAIQDECEKVGGVYEKLSDLHIKDALRGPAGKTDVFGGPSDNFHPNDEGYAAIADRLLNRIAIAG